MPHGLQFKIYRAYLCFIRHAFPSNIVTVLGNDLIKIRRLKLATPESESTKVKG